MMIATATLPDVATLYSTAGADATGVVGERVRHEIADILSELFADVDPEVLRDAMGVAVASVPQTEDGRLQQMQHIAIVLNDRLDDKTCGRILLDLCRIAGSDGIVTGSERKIVGKVASVWNLEMPSIDQPLLGRSSTSAAWSAAHDLALVYLGLAHGADEELSRSEVNAMVQTLQRWLPELTSAESAGVLRDAMEHYAGGPRELLVDQAVAALRDSLSLDQRRRALADLVRIANADGVFLDNEEDLIVRLQSEWEVDPDALYE